MVIAALDHVPQCYTSADGLVIAGTIRRCLRQGGATLSFFGVDDVPSSFVNSAIVSLLDEFSSDEIRKRLSIVDSNRQINDMIRRCMMNAARAPEYA
ncbi:STAS-like domain-containing protein [Sphingomonas sp. PAMC 26617]|uniref:STAS-like domain-containing protein n=1 Tax=Sphingomonas sp. PAMC 26617 TaxID=1112216 RepID=UPI0002891EE2